MEVIILAGGLGTRLRSVVSEVPKCMAPVSGKPFLWYLLKYLTRYDVDRVILSVGYLREAIYKWIDTVQDEFPFSFDYSVEKEPLGTGGGIKLAMSLVKDEKVIVLNGDTFFDVDLNTLIAVHKKHPEAKITIALKLMKNFERYGTVVTRIDGRVLKFTEKQPCKEGEINGGVYVLAKEDSLFEGQPQFFSFETAIMQEKCCEIGCLYGVALKGYFIDIGIPEDYDRAQIELAIHVNAYAMNEQKNKSIKGTF